MDPADAGDAEDQRVVELGTLAAIYPEMVVDERDAFAVMLEVPVNPQTAVKVSFPATAAGALDVHELSYLPSMQVRVCLPPGYPEQQPPQIQVTTDPPWMPAAVLRSLEDDGVRLWEELGRDLVVFAFVDHVRQAADDVFGLADSSGFLFVDRQHQVFVLDYDIKAKQAAFDKETFACGICLDPKKGSACHRMKDCGHVFCVLCLQDFYGNAIRTGDLSVVRCPEPNCAKKREVPQPAGRKRRPKAVTVSPGELLQIPIAEELVQRYVDLKYKTQLESDRDTVYCPRSWCSGAARSDRHQRPVGLVEVEVEVEVGEDDHQEGEDDSHDNTNDSSSDRRLAICEDCRFAFCTRCRLSWHGDFVYCALRRRDGELAEPTEEELATLRYIARYTTPCPTCAAAVQKSRGCNHMICSRCDTDFCYLCSAWLDAHNPYQHFNSSPSGKRTACYNRLFDGKDGEEDDDGFGEPAELPPDAGADADGFDFVDFDFGPANDRQHRQAVPAAVPPEQAAVRLVSVAREGPLVLRIALENGPAQPRQPVAVAPVVPVVPAVPLVPLVPVAPPHPARNVDRRGPDGQRGRGQGQARGRGRGQGRGRGRGGDRGGGRGRGRAADRLLGDGQRLPAAEVLDGDMEAWVRHFVQLALEDNEHLMDV